MEKRNLVLNSSANGNINIVLHHIDVIVLDTNLIDENLILRGEEKVVRNEPTLFSAKRQFCVESVCRC